MDWAGFGLALVMACTACHKTAQTQPDNIEIVGRLFKSPDLETFVRLRRVSEWSILESYSFTLSKQRATGLAELFHNEEREDCWHSEGQMVCNKPFSQRPEKFEAEIRHLFAQRADEAVVCRPSERGFERYESVSGKSSGPSGVFWLRQGKVDNCDGAPILNVEKEHVYTVHPLRSVEGDSLSDDWRRLEMSLANGVLDEGMTGILRLSRERQ